MKRKMLGPLVLLVLVAAALWPLAGALVADEPDPNENVVAIHDTESLSYDKNCLGCHASVLTEQSKDPRISAFHVAMLPYTPGYNPRKGATNDVCIQCHRKIDILVDSAGALRKQVDPELCALCHGPSGPGPVYYEK